VSHGCAILKVLLFVSICCNIIVGPKKKVVHFSGSFPPTFGIMINSNLLEILQNFTKEQLSSLQEYLHWSMREQPFDRKEALQLLEIIVDHYPDLQHEGLQKEAVFAQMFPKKAFVERKVDKIMVNLAKGLRSFQLHQHYLQPENEFHQLLDILQVYKAKGMVARYQQGFKQLEAYMKANPKQSLKAAFEFYQFQYEKLDWNSLHNNQRSDLDLPVSSSRSKITIKLTGTTS